MSRTKAMRRGLGVEGRELHGVVMQLAAAAALGLGVHAASGWIADALVTLFG
jgi:hypothetical protein